MKSKACYAFKQKLQYFNDDLELIDALRTSVLNGENSDANSTHVLRHVDPARHRHLTRRQNSDHSRKLAINHLRSSLYSSYLKDLYEEVTHYLRSALEHAAKNGFNAGQIVGEHNFKMNASTVLSLGSWEEVCRVVAESLFQNLEAERSTLDLLKKMKNKLGLDVDDTLIDAALPYLGIRHFLVHSDGKLSPEYRSKNPHIPVKANGKVNLSYKLITAAGEHIVALIDAYDAELLSKNLFSSNDIQ